jgi:outer membrane protein assembly factor BamB
MADGRGMNASVERSAFRYWFPRIVLILGMVGVAIIWVIPAPDFERNRHVLRTIIALLVIFGLLGIWLLALSGYPWRRRLGLFLVSLLLIAGAGWACVRGIQFTGDLVPIVRFRWERNRDLSLEADRKRQAAVAAPVAVGFSGIRESDFPEYRGRHRDGVAHGPAFSRDWKARPPRRLWRQPVGGGYAAFAVAGRLAVTIEQRRDREAVVCYDTATGKELWVHDYPAHFSESLGGDGPRATPTIADGSVFSLGATGRLVCLDLASGKLQWQVNILEDNDNLPWGMSGSPLVYDQVVVVNPGTQRKTAAGRAVVAYERATGKQVWSTGNTKAGYSSPMLATLAGRRQILLLDGEVLAGYDSQSGHELWHFPWQTFQDINVAQPVVLDGDRVFISSGYGKGCALVRVSESAGNWKVEPLWRNQSMHCKFTSPVAYKGFLYGLDEGILTCVDQETGKRTWRDGHYGHGQLLRADDLLVIQSETGKLVLVEATPEGHHELASIPALEGRTWNNPALADGKVYLRNSEEMACYDLAGAEAALVGPQTNASRSSALSLIRSSQP